jgi:hypothetical protein
MYPQDHKKHINGFIQGFDYFFLLCIISSVGMICVLKIKSIKMKLKNSGIYLKGKSVWKGTGWIHLARDVAQLHL